MAILSFSDVQADLVFPQNRAAKAVAQWNRRAKTLSQFKVDFAPRGAQNCAFVVKLSNKTARAYADGYAVQPAEFDSDLRKVCSLPWARYRSPLGVTPLTLSVGSRGIGGSDATLDLLFDEIENAALKLASELNKEIIVGTGSSDRILGVDNVLVTSGSPYGLNVATYTELRGIVNGSVGTLTPANLGAVLDSVEVASGSRPGVQISSFDVRRKMLNDGILEGRKQYADGQRPDYATGDPDTLTFEENPVLADKDYASGTMKALSLDTWKIMCMVDPESFAAGAKVVQIPGIPIPFILFELGNDGGGRKYVLTTPQIQLVCERPNANAKLAGITV